jgi:hypothetical protein
MKKLFVIFFSVAYLLPLINTATVIVDFKINQDFIAKVLCINKEKPELKCNGNCHLKEKLSDKPLENQEAPPRVQQREIVQFITATESLGINYFPGKTVQKAVYINPLYVGEYNSNVFHPPKFC